MSRILNFGERWCYNQWPQSGQWTLSEYYACCSVDKMPLPSRPDAPDEMSGDFAELQHFMAAE
jgi:hypothetical protein